MKTAIISLSVLSALAVHTAAEAQSISPYYGRGVLAVPAQQPAANMDYLAPSAGGSPSQPVATQDDTAYATAAAEGTVQRSASDPSVEFVTGGIGEPSRSMIESTKNNYSVKLSYAAVRGQYLADVNVQIANASGVVLDTNTDGPFLLAKLKPGSYTVTSTYNGVTKTNKITVGSGGLKTYNIFFETQES